MTGTVFQLSILAAVAFVYVIIPGSNQLFPSKNTNQPSLLVIAIGLTFLMYMYASAVMYIGSGRSSLYKVSNEQRMAMDWVKTYTSKDERFIVFIGDTSQIHAIEWFPYIADRYNETTYQGYEWVGQFHSRLVKENDLRNCSTQSVDCVEQWMKNYQVKAEKMFLIKAGNEIINESFVVNGRYERVFENEEVVVYDIR